MRVARYASKHGNWAGGQVGRWCSGEMCTGFPYAKCKVKQPAPYRLFSNNKHALYQATYNQYKTHIWGFKGGHCCPQAWNCGFHVMQKGDYTSLNMTYLIMFGSILEWVSTEH